MSSEGIMRHARRLIFVSWLTLFVSAAFAQSPPARDRDDLDVTMHVIVDPDAKVPDEIARRIPLPKPAQPVKPDKPVKPGAQDQKPAAQGNGEGREFGQQVSDDAKQRSEEARNNKNPPPGKPPGKPPEKPPGKPPEKPPEKPPGKPPEKPPGKPPSPPGRPTPGG